MRHFLGAVFPDERPEAEKPIKIADSYHVEGNDPRLNAQ